MIEATTQHNRIDQASSVYLFELIDEILSKTTLACAVNYHCLEQFISHIYTIDIQKDIQSARLLAHILFTILAKQFRDIDTDEQTEETSLIENNGIQQHVFELILYLFNRQHKQSSPSRWRISQYVS